MAIAGGLLRLWILVTLVLAAAPAVSRAAPWQEAESDAPAESDVPVVAITGARVHTMADAGVLPAGTILIREGKIEAVGEAVEVPEGAEVIDATGMIVTPGLVDLRSSLWLTGDAVGDSGSTAAMDAMDGVDPFLTDWREVARQGITAVYVQPAPNGSLGGYGAVLRAAAGDGTVESIVLKKQTGFQSSLGVATANGSSKSRLSEYKGLKKRFKDAKSYKEAWDKYREYEKKQAEKEAASKEKKDSEKDDSGEDAEGESPEEAKQDEGADSQQGRAGRSRGGRGPGRGGPPAQDDPAPDKDDESSSEKAKKDSDGKEDDDSKKEEEKAPEKPKFDPLKERLVEVLEGKLPLRMEVHRGDELTRALELAKEFELTVVLEGLTETGSHTDKLIESQLPIVLGPWSDDARQSFQSADRSEHWGAHFADYPGRVAIATFSRNGRASKALRFDAAMAIAAGFDADRALAGITSVAAQLAGVGDAAGRIQPGLRADLAIFAGDPLDPSTPVFMTISGGEITHRSDAAQAKSQAADASDTEASDRQIPQALPARYAMRSSRVLTEDGVLRPATVVVRDGVIAAIDASDAEVDGIPLFDVSDAVLTPGLVSAHAVLTPGAFRDDQNVVDSGSLRTSDVYDPEATAVLDLIAGGFLRAGHAAGDNRVIAGPIADVRLGADSPLVAPRTAEKLVLSSEARSRERFPSSLAGQQQLVRDSLSDRPVELSLVLPDAALKVLNQARSDRRQALTEGNLPVLFKVGNEAEILAAIKLAAELGLNANLLAPDEVRDTADVLVKQGLGIVVRPIRANDYDWYAIDLAEAASAGVPMAFSGTDPLEIRRTAAALVQAGMPSEAALSALTQPGASLVGMSASAGALLVGEPADFVLWNDSPLNLAARPLAVVVDGKLVETDD